MKRVAVIGAGAFGLCALRHLTSFSEYFDVVAYEGDSDIGGLWRYKEDLPHNDDYAIYTHNSIYKNLRTNIPKELMAFPDFPFDEKHSVYPNHTEVINYLENYAQKFKLKKHIKFQTFVTNVEAENNGGNATWRVTSHASQTATHAEETFDAVFVCNGHYAIPAIPNIPGSEMFEGKILHSKVYKEGTVFRDKNIVIVGMGLSGLDILYELAPVAKKIYAAHDGNKLQSKIPINAKEMPGIKQIKKTGVIFKNNEFYEVDVIIYCTGYKYSFPFLSGSCQLQLTDDGVTPLYKNIFNVKFPSLSFIGLLHDGVMLPFQIANLQVLYACKVLKGDIQLPARAVRFEDFQRQFNKNLHLKKKVHRLSEQEQWEYISFLEKQCFVQLTTTHVKQLVEYNRKIKEISYQNFRDENININIALIE